MVNILEVPYESIEYFIYVAFREDEELLDKYHTVDKTLEECVNNLVKQIGEFIKYGTAKCYGIFYVGEPIGFSVIGDRFLFSFGIDVHFREKDILLEWFDQLKFILGNEFVTWLYNDNTRAINFFERNGMDVVEENETYKTLVYINNLN